MKTILRYINLSGMESRILWSLYPDNKLTMREIMDETDKVDHASVHNSLHTLMDREIIGRTTERPAKYFIILKDISNQ